MIQDKKKEIDFFDKFIQEKNEYAVFSTKGYDKLLFELTKSLKFKNNKIKIIDLGCGTGTFTKKMSSLSSEIYGCDISPKSIEKASEKYPEINFSIQDIENLKFENNFFDVVTFSGVLHHFKDFSIPLKEAKRILKEDGLIFAFDPNLYNPFFWLYRRKESWFYSKSGVTDNEEPLSKKKIIETAKLCGFEEIDVYGISDMSFKYIESKKLSFFLPIYNFVDGLFNIIPFVRNNFGSFLITIIKK